MSREIKFRAWVISEKRFIYSKDFKNLCNFFLEILTFHDLDIILQQYIKGMFRNIIIISQKDMKKEIIKIILENTEYWQPESEMGDIKTNIGIIERKEPFFWRINPKWAEEVADKIVSKISAK